MSLSSLAYGAYERRLLHRLRPDQLPKHVGAIVDGNRRWARFAGTNVYDGYQAGASKIVEFLGWCDEIDVEIATLWLLSTDNLRRPPIELNALLKIIEQLVVDLASTRKWRVQIIGSIDLLPEQSAARLKSAVSSTDDVDGMVVNICVGYGGRQELTDAMRSLLVDKASQGVSLIEVAQTLEVDHIAEHLYTKGQPDPDLVIRTSGEQRLSGFLLWQSVHSEFYFCDAMWPAFRRVDFLRAIRSYSSRDRRFGS
ncbi:isoprenyl transferase [soil metagenome]